MCELKYLLKLVFDWDLLVPLCLISALLVMAATGNIYRQIDGYLGVYSVLEIYLPLFFSYILAGLVPDEVETGFLELLLSYPQKRWKLITKKLLAAALMIVLMFVPVLTYIYNAYTLDFRRLLMMAVPPAVALSGVTFLISMITQKKIASMLLAGIYWAFETTTKGVYTGRYSLYYASFFGETGYYMINRLGLFALGTVCVFISLALFERLNTAGH